MAIGNFTLTGHFDTLSGFPATGTVRIDGNPQIITDSSGNKTRVGPRTVVLNGTGDFSVTLPSDSTTGNSTSIAFKVTPKLTGLAVVAPVNFYARPIGSTVDLRTLLNVSVPELGNAPTGPQGATGATGAQGPQGLPGVNAVANDTATAGYVGGPSSTKTALDAAYTQLTSVASTVTASATLTANRHTPVDATSGSRTMTLPTAAAGALVSVEKTDASANAVNVTGTLRGTAAQSIALTSQYDARTFLSEGGGSWRPVSDHRTKTSLDATYETQTRANDRAIRVADFGTLGTADDSTTISAALAAANGKRVVFPPNASLTAAQSSVTNLANATIDGNGATITLKATGARIAGIRLFGTISGVTVSGLGVTGNGSLTDAHSGVVIGSGAAIDNFTVSKCRIRNTTLGVSVNADGSGTMNGVTYEGNLIDTITGTATGFGYGLHVDASGTAPTNIQIRGNTIRSAQRHSIYQAKGRGVSIMGNTISNHRDASKDGTVLPAIMMARSADVTIVGNTVVNSAGGALFLGGIATGDQAEGYTVVGNTFSEAQDAAVLVYIGQQDPVNEGFPTGVVFAHNTLKNSNVAGQLQIFNGKQIIISRNIFRCTATTAATSALILNGVGVTGNDYMDDISIEGNFFDQGHASTVLMRFSPGHETDTTRYWFRGNRKTGAKLGVMFSSSANITNPNIDIQDQVRDGFATTVATLSAALGGVIGTASPAAGGAGALPATPATYLTVNVNGTDRRIPLY